MTNNSISRRRLLTGSALALVAIPAIATLPGCEVSTVNGVTTVTLDVARIKNYGQAGLNTASLVTGYMSSFPALAAYTAPISAASALLSSEVGVFANAVGDKLTITYNNATWKTRVDSIFTDIEDVASKINDGIKASVGVIPNSVVTDASNAYKALVTLVSVFKALIGSTASYAPGKAAMTRQMALDNLPVPETGMTEAEALKILGVN